MILSGGSGGTNGDNATAGTASTVNTNLVVANGGGRGAVGPTGAGGAGATAGIGNQITRTGGSGATPAAGSAGAGGGAGGVDSNGGNGVNITAGVGGGGGAGNGGNGFTGNNGSGTNGNTFGGGGGGSVRTNNGRAGANGAVRFTWEEATITYTLQYYASAGGSISGTAIQYVDAGDSGTSVTAIPNTGYEFVQWSDSSTQNPRTDINVQGDISVTAQFALKQYTLTYTAGSGGTISGISPQTINHGSSGTQITAVPNTGYDFVQWSDGLMTASRTDTNVTANATYTATFALKQYTLTYTAGSGGTISGISPQTINHGSSGTQITAVPNTGYDFVQWSDGLMTASRTDSNVTANISVTAQFSAQTTDYTLTYTAGAGGTIVGTTPQVVPPGGDGTQVTATPNTGYSFSSWTGTHPGGTAARTDTNVQSDITVTANFTINTYTVNYWVMGNEGGTIFGEATQLVQYGGSGTQVTAVPASGYVFSHWSDGVTNPTRTDTNITSIRRYTAYFDAAPDASTDYSFIRTSIGNTGSIQIWTVPSTGVYRITTYGAMGIFDVSSYQSYPGGKGAKMSGEFSLNAGDRLRILVGQVGQAINSGYGAAGGGTFVVKEVSSGGDLMYDGQRVVPLIVSGGGGGRSWLTGYTEYNYLADAVVGVSGSSAYTGALGGTDGNGGAGADTTSSGGGGGGYYTAGGDAAGTGKGGSSFLAGGVGGLGATSRAGGFGGGGGSSNGPGAGGGWSGGGGSGTLTARISGGGGSYNSGANQTNEGGVRKGNGLVEIKLVGVSEYTLTYTAGAGGTISGTSPQTVSSGGSGTQVTAVPNTGYDFVQWSDGIMTAARTDTNVTANKSVTAQFAIKQYTLLYNPGTGGSLSGSTTQFVNHGDSGTAVTANPDSGYAFLQWSDGSTQNPRTDTNVTADKSVTAQWTTIPTYTLTYSAGAGGTISGTSPQTVLSGSSGTQVTAVPNTGYNFVQWSDGIMTAAQFALKQYTLTYTAGTGGTVSGTSPQTVNHGSNGTQVTAIPNVDYTFLQWSDGSTQNPRTDTNVTSNKSLTASFFKPGAINTQSSPANQKVTLSSKGRGLVAYLPLKLKYTKSTATAGSEIFSDLSPYTNDGQNFGAVATANYLTFDGVNDYVRLASSASLQAQTNLTLTAWVRPGTSYAGDVIILGQGAYQLVIGSDWSARAYWQGKNPAGYHSSGAGSISSDQWNFIVATWDASNFRIYVNGELKNTVGCTGAGALSGQVWIGAENNGASRPFKGDIANVRIYGSALSTTEIAALFDQGLDESLFIIKDLN